jgi:ATP phosphoribosyltransferase regulatory subunit
VIEVASEACRRAGLAEFRIELGQVRFAQIALDEVPSSARDAVSDALAHKDGARLARVLSLAGVPAKARKPVLGLVDLYGGPEVLPVARRRFATRDASNALDEIERVVERLVEAKLAPDLGIDLGEVRGQAYYTGVSFTILAHGPGEAIAAGGRYDQLLERYGVPAPATGFALDVGHLEWALEVAGRPFTDPERPLRVLLAGGRSAPWLEAGRALRRAGASIAHTEPGTDPKAALDYARAWGYDSVVVAVGKRAKATRIHDGTSRALRVERPEDLAALARWARANEKGEER